MNQEPQATPEITAFIAAWDEYAEAARNYGNGLDYYKRSNCAAVIEYNLGRLKEIIERAQEMLGKTAIFDLTHAEAALEYLKAKDKWEREQEEERRRPENEWNIAKDKHLKDLDRAIRGVAIKNGKLNAKRWNAKGEERAAIEAQILENEYAANLAQSRRAAVEWARYRDYEGRAFDADLIAELEAEQEERTQRLIEHFREMVARDAEREAERQAAELAAAQTA